MGDAHSTTLRIRGNGRNVVVLKPRQTSIEGADVCCTFSSPLTFKNLMIRPLLCVESSLALSDAKIGAHILKLDVWLGEDLVRVHLVDGGLQPVLHLPVGDGVDGGDVFQILKLSLLSSIGRRSVSAAEASVLAVLKGGWNGRS